MSWQEWVADGEKNGHWGEYRPALDELLARVDALQLDQSGLVIHEQGRGVPTYPGYIYGDEIFSQTDILKNKIVMAMDASIYHPEQDGDRFSPKLAPARVEKIKDAFEAHIGDIAQALGDETLNPEQKKAVILASVKELEAKWAATDQWARDAHQAVKAVPAASAATADVNSVEHGGMVGSHGKGKGVE